MIRFSTVFLLFASLMLSQEVYPAECGNAFQALNGENPGPIGSDEKLDLSRLPWSSVGPLPSNPLSSGDYYIDEGSYGSITLVPGAIVRIFVAGDITFGNNVGVNAAGQPSQLLIAARGNIAAGNSAEIRGLLYATGDITIGIGQGGGALPTISGGLASEQLINLPDSASVTVDYEGIDNGLLDGLCPPVGPEEPTIDHFEIIHDGSALTCQPEPVRIRACANQDCSELFNDAVQVALATSSAWQWIGGNEVSFVNGYGAASVRRPTAGTVTLDVTSSTPPAQTQTVCDIGGSVSVSNCELPFSESGFLLNVPNHISGQTVLAAILAVKAGEADPGQCVPAFTGPKNIRFITSHQNPGTGTLAVESGGIALSGNALTLDFDGTGAASFPVRYRDVGDVLLQARFDGTGEEGGLVMLGQDRFIARPDRFEVRIPDNPASPDVNDTTVFRTAGDAFSVEVQALNALDERTPNFGQESPREAVTLTVVEAANLPVPNLAPLEGTLGLFGQSCVTVQGGKACGEFSWPEVGTFSLAPSLSSGAYLGTEDVVSVPVPYVGRFIPAWFEISIDRGRFSSAPLSSDRTSCTGERSWVYTGEPFGWGMAPEVVITPKNRNGVTVQNYAGTLFQRVGVDDVGFAPFPVEDEAATGVDGAPLELEAALALPTLSPDLSGSLIYSFAAGDEYRYPKTRNVRIPGYRPEAVFSLENLIDADGVTVLDPTENLPEVFKPEADFEIRYGRVALNNGFGPENLDLVIPLRAEVFGSGGFQLHQDETCWLYDLPENTSVDFAGSSFTSGQTGVVEVADLELTLEDGRPRVTAVEDYRLRLSAPIPSGTESAQTRGIYVELDAGNDWLKDFWDAGNPEALVNPYAWATFGVYRGNDRIIYWREVRD